MNRGLGASWPNERRRRVLEHIPSLKKLAHTPLETMRYLELNTDSIHVCGKRYRAGQRISTGFAESAVNEIISKRITKKQRMRWNRYTVQRFLDVRIPSLAQRLPAGRCPDPRGSVSMTSPQLCTLSA
jgi:hypothetical protein